MEMKKSDNKNYILTFQEVQKQFVLHNVLTYLYGFDRIAIIILLYSDSVNSPPMQ